MQWPGDANQMLSEIGEDAPVMSLIGVGQSRARNFAAEAHAIQFAAQRSEARLNVSQTLAVGKLRKGHGQILIPARETPVMTVASITGNALLELVMGEEGNQLSEYSPAGIHPLLFRRSRPRVFPGIGGGFDSN